MVLMVTTQEEYAIKHTYPLGDKFFFEILQTEMKGDLSYIDLTTRYQINLRQVNYLEFTINKYAVQGWELDRIRNLRERPSDGCLIFKKEVI